MKFKLIPRNDPAQAVRMRRTLLACIGAFLHSSVGFVLYKFGYFRSSLYIILPLASLVWIGNSLIVLAIRTGFNKKFRDPSLTLFQMLWATIWIMGTIYHQYALRPLTLMIYFGVILFGSFYLNRRQFIAVTLFAIILYGFTLYLVFYFHPNTFRMRTEIVEFSVFSMVAISLTVLGMEMSALRSKLSRSNYQLQRAVNRIRKLATTDELTGLFNRRHILDKMEEQKKLADNRNKPFTLCLLDLDHFKLINDNFGHQIGDETLKKFADTAGGRLREKDYFARYGGEEFILLMGECTDSQAYEVMEQIRKKVAAENMSDIHPDLKLTVSIGITQYRSPESIDDAFHRADLALYRAKERGRNRVELQ